MSNQDDLDEDAQALTLIRPQWRASKSRVPEFIKVATSTRAGGVSEKPFDSLNLGHHVEDNPAHVQINQRRITEALQLPSAPVWLNQVHGCDILEVKQPPTDIPEADAAICRQPDTVLAILTADCLPLVLIDAEQPAIAVIHCGWRGLACGIVQKTVAALGGEPSSMRAWLGPAIGPDCFEVGDEVWDQFVVQDWQMAKCFSATGRQTFNADIYALATRILHQQGIHSISGGQYCTVTDAELFYSYRREGQTGRMATFAWMTSDAVR